MNTEIVFFEPSPITNSHIDFTAGIMAAFHCLCPDSPFLFYGEKEHISVIDGELNKNYPHGITHRPVRFPRKGGLYAVRLFFAFWKTFREIDKIRPRTVVLLNVSPAVFFLTFRLPLFRRSKVIAFCHSGLVSKYRSANLLHRIYNALVLTPVLTKRSKNRFFVVLGDRQKTNILSILPGANIVSIDQPIRLCQETNLFNGLGCGWGGAYTQNGRLRYRPCIKRDAAAF